MFYLDLHGHLGQVVLKDADFVELANKPVKPLTVYDENRLCAFDCKPIYIDIAAT